MAQAQVALVTGVSSGIGRAIQERLSSRGFRVFGTMRSPEPPDGWPSEAERIPLDVRDQESVRSCVGTVLDHAGRIDALVNNAGCMLFGSLEETGIEEAREVFETNFFGVLRITQAVLPAMRRQRYGRIVNIGSLVGVMPAPYQGIYAASKHALEGYSESLDHEVRRFGIRVSVVEPGFTRTELARNGRLTGQSLAAYDGDRHRVVSAVQDSIANGEDPAVVASVVLEALNSPVPRMRYPAGREAKFLSLLRKFAPFTLFDKGLRKQFGLGTG